MFRRAAYRILNGPFAAVRMQRAAADPRALACTEVQERTVNLAANRRFNSSCGLKAGMAEVIPFPTRSDPSDEVDVDILTTLDVAIRDLRDISRQLADEPTRRQADECRRMLEKALISALSAP